MNIIRVFLFIFITSSSLFSYSQISDSSLNIAQQLPKKYYSKINKKINSVDDQLTKKSIKYLAKFQRQEQQFQQRLQKLNPELIVTNADEKYKELLQKIKASSKSQTWNSPISGEYNPYMDSLGTSLSFLKQFKGISDKVKSPLNSFDQLQSNLQESEKIKAFIAERKNQIKELLSKYTKLPAGLKNEYAKLNKTAYYYSAQVKEYKEMLKDPKKIEQKALTLLNKIPAFQKFMKENSQLGNLFAIPVNYSNSQSLQGLQTIEQVQQIISSRIGTGPNATQMLRQQMQAAQGELNKFKDKLAKLGRGSGDIEMPDFKPNGQKTKSFSQRLEYGFNVQFSKNNSLLPSTSDLALSMGYKLSDKSVIGLGLSYKIGIGTLERIQFTSQGLGFRSFLDWKLKGKIYLSGGYEMNYNAAFKNIQQLKKFEAWQRSGLIGFSKKYSIGKKRKGEAKILYDFLANDHMPRSQPLLFRVGYGLK